VSFNYPGSLPVVIPQPPITLLVPVPTGGGVVGLQKVSEDNNPLPRDRFIFNYDYFDNVPLTPHGVSVNRFSPGFEKTFFDRRASVEVRVPFAATLSSDILADGVTNTNRAELGDVHITLKGLAYRSDSLYVAGGLAFDIPTADGTRVLLSDGTTLVRVRNDSLLMTPYLAYLWVPNNRLFFQNWYQFVFDTNGDMVQVNGDGSGLTNIGRLHQQSLLEIDAQLGYWVYQSNDSSSFVRAAAPFIELHYNSTMGKSDMEQGGGFSIGFDNSHFDELNMSTGVTTWLRNNLLLSAGATFPLKGHDDRSFDYQLGIRASLFFGPTARYLNRATPVSSY
jgi:hypothetical protein